jgi:hypothetical protein
MRVISLVRLPGSSAMRCVPCHGSAAGGSARVSAARSTSGWPVNCGLSGVSRKSSGSKGKMQSSWSRKRAILGMRLRCHAHTCGQM